MKKMNKQGFAFSELLMVTVVIIGIFMIIYTNIFPIMGELENRDKYNDVSANYVAFYLRKALQNVNLATQLGENKYVVLYPDDTVLNTFSDFLDAANVEKVILTKDVLSDLKGAASDDKISDLSDYIDYLPYYYNLDDDIQQYRLIIKTATGYSTTLIKFSKDDYAYLFNFDDDNNIVSAVDKFPNDLETVYIPDFVNGIEFDSDSWDKMLNLNSVYLNIFKDVGVDAYIDGAVGVFNLPSTRNLNLFIYDCKESEIEVIKSGLGISDDNVTINCLQKESVEGVDGDEETE